MQFALMIEGQNGLTWPRWQAIALAAEELGFAGLYRSDHFTNANPPDKESLELWTSLTWLASHTQRIEFGPMVSPVSFRHPVFTARMAKDVDDLSGGRLTLGVGAGWQEREHAKFHFDLLDLPARFDRFEEGLEIITRPEARSITGSEASPRRVSMAGAMRSSTRSATPASAHAARASAVQSSLTSQQAIAFHRHGRPREGKRSTGREVR